LARHVYGKARSYELCSEADAQGRDIFVLGNVLGFVFSRHVVPTSQPFTRSSGEERS